MNWYKSVVAMACAAFPVWLASGAVVADEPRPLPASAVTALPAVSPLPPTWQTPGAMSTPASGETELSRVSYSEFLGGPEQSSSDLHESCGGCCAPPWVHRTGLFADILYLRARNAEVAYVVPINGAIVPPPGVAPIQVGAIGVTDPDYTPAFRVGGTWALDECASVVFTYTRFDSTTTDAQTIDAPNVLRSLVLHPGTSSADSDFLNANANLGIDLNVADVDFRAVWDAGEYWAINYLVGARYARLNQDFASSFTSTGSVDQLATNLNFDGGGIRVGIDGERHSGCGFLLYGRATASFVGGEFRGRYSQTSDLAADPIVNTSWTSGRLVSILDLELGAGWQSSCGRLRLSAGYVVNSWFNAVTTNEWISSVQTNNYGGLGNGMTFDGLVGRVEFRF